MLKRTVIINGAKTTFVADAEEKLSDVLRKQLGLTGTKVGCGSGECGTCTVILNGKLVRSCITKMKKIEDNDQIITVEGVGTKDNLHPVQIAWMVHGGAQCGFCTPGFIVSSKALLEANNNPTREEVRDWFQKNKNLCRCTGYKPLVDAVMDAAKIVRGELSVKDFWKTIPEGASLIGSSLPRPSAMAKVLGTWDFGADLGLKLPSTTLHAKLVQAKVSHANILSIDTEEAKKVPGVVAVLTYKDVKGTNRINGLAFPSNKGDGLDRPILNDTKIFQFGDAIAIVLAENEKAAHAGVDKVKVEIEELPAYMNAPDAMADDAIEIHPGTPNVYFTNYIAKGGDTAPIMSSAPHVVEDSFYVQRQPHLPLESDVGFAYVNDEGKLIIHSKSIALHFHALMIAEGVGMKAEDVFIVQNNIGATFGYKFSPTIEALLGVATLATGRPVYLEFNMFQQITYTGKRSPFWTTMKMAADKEGKILAMESDWSVDHGPYSEFGDLLTQRGFQFGGAGYNIDNIRGNGRTVCTNHGWGSAFRGYGAPEIMFPSEVLVDELAEKVGMDPFDLRYKNIYREGSTTPTGCAPDAYCLEGLFDKSRPVYELAKKTAASKNASSDGVKKYGVGVSVNIYGCGLDGPDTSEAWAEVTSTGVSIGTSWEDHGQGADIGTLTYAHETLRPLHLSIEQIDLVMNDMTKTPNSGPSGGSRQNLVTGNAITVACKNLLEAMKKADGTYRTYAEMVAEGREVKYMGKWTAPCTDTPPTGGQGNPFAGYMYGVCVAEVEVDTKTGKTQVEKMTLASDIGTVINKLAADGQMYGGLVQGIGLALTEDFDDLKKHTTLTGCGFPKIKDVPDNLNLIYTETPRANNFYGASGAGEMPLAAPHAAIINAIYNACGARVTHLPARPEKVLAALAK